MDRIQSAGSSLPQWQPRAAAHHDPDASPFAELMSLPTRNARDLPDSAAGKDPADEKQRMAHFVSHVDAECFISLLQTMDPMPYDHRARAEYKRHYAQLRDVLTVPLPPQDTGPVDPLK